LYTIVETIMQRIDRSIPFDLSSVEVVRLGSQRDLDLQHQLDISTSPSPLLSNDVNSLTYNCPDCNLECVSTDISTTMFGFSSPDGHDHDYNCRTFRFTCAKGH